MTSDATPALLKEFGIASTSERIHGELRGTAVRCVYSASTGGDDRFDLSLSMQLPELVGLKLELDRDDDDPRRTPLERLWLDDDLVRRWPALAQTIHGDEARLQIWNGACELGATLHSTARPRMQQIAELMIELSRAPERRVQELVAAFGGLGVVRAVPRLVLDEDAVVLVHDVVVRVNRHDQSLVTAIRAPYDGPPFTLARGTGPRYLRSRGNPGSPPAAVSQAHERADLLLADGRHLIAQFDGFVAGARLAAVAQLVLALVAPPTSPYRDALRDERVEP